MKEKKKIFFLVITLSLSLIVFGGISISSLNPVSTKAQTSSVIDFNTINQMAKTNNESPSFWTSQEIAGALIDNLSTLYIPKELQTTTIDQVAAAHLNGSSAIDENNIVNSVNALATQASAPSYAFTNFEQVKVVRTFLNRVMPDLVSPSGPMTDLEAFAVFVATVSQKTDNDVFMVTPAEFTASMGSSTTQPFPGSTAAGQTALSVETESIKAAEMIEVIDEFVNSKNMMSGNDMISSIGIQ